MAGDFDKLQLGFLKKHKFGGSNSYQLTVGNHLLDGKLQKLERPVVVTEKVVASDEAVTF